LSVPDRLESLREGDSLTNALAVVRRRWLLVVGVVAACVVATVVNHERGAKAYSATASVAFQAATLPDAALQVSSSGSSEPQRTADTEVLIAHSSEVAEGVRKQLNSPVRATSLLKSVKVEAAPNADVLNIVASTGSPTYSARLANAFAVQYIAFKAAAQVATIEAAEKKLNERIAALPAGSSARASLEQSQQRLAGLRAVTGGGANIISLATPPDAPSGVGLAATLVIGLLVGLILAGSLVFLVESLDRRVKTIEEFEYNYRLSALTAVPQSAFNQRRASDRAEQLEPYRILRSALDFTAVARKLDILLVTSAVAGEGKTTVAVDLAQAFALAGRDVLLAELDLRRPTFTNHFELRRSGGLTTALANGEGISELLVTPIPGLPNLAVLPAGRIPPNPSELLGSPAMGELLGEMSGERLVIVDAPPLNPVADTQVLLNNPAISAVLLVARINVTTREQVRRARAILDRHTVTPVGLAVTDLREPGRYGYEPYRSNTPALDRPAGEGLSRKRGYGERRPVS
jgi:capsular exopolysaccharide synthesis family protein